MMMRSTNDVSSTAAGPRAVTLFIASLIAILVCLTAAGRGSCIAEDVARDANVARPPQALPGTAALEWAEADLSERLMDGAHRFVEAQIQAAGENRGKYWRFDRSSDAAWNQAVEPNRAELRRILGIQPQRQPPQMERFGDDDHPAQIAETDTFTVWQVRWPVLPGLSGTGLLVQPKRTSPAGRLALIPDPSVSPEDCLFAPKSPGNQNNPNLASIQGNTTYRQSTIALAEAGWQIVIPMLIAREPLETSDPAVRASQQTGREWLYRQGYHLGQHLLGLEVQTILAAVDWFEEREKTSTDKGGRIAVAGWGDGGQVAFYSAALDPRIQTAVVSGYFDRRERVWEEPLDRHVWRQLDRFGDAEIAALVLPRELVIEHAPVSPFTSTKGERHTAVGETVRAEVARIVSAAPLGSPPTLISGEDGQPVGPLSEAVTQKLLADGKVMPGQRSVLVDGRLKFSPNARQRRAVHEYEQFYQRLLQQCAARRDERVLLRALPKFSQWAWSTNRTEPLTTNETLDQTLQEFRAEFRREAIGQFEEPYLPPRPRTRLVMETEKWTAWDVVLDVWPDVFAWGVLILPKDLTPGERRPVVVCQHGRHGLPIDTFHRTGPQADAYNEFAARLAERGFITFAPHNLYRGEDRYRWLNRKANTVGKTLFSFIAGQHEQILNWLTTLPMVDGERIAFYGLSYGGETAVRIPPILDKYALSICSGDFNQWTTKVAATDQPFSFMRTIEWEMPYWNWGPTFDYAEMAYMMYPRPFMVERGHLDLVGRDQWVAAEYAKVRFFYAQLGHTDRTEIEFFQGGHAINGVGTFQFLHRHLNWPER